MLDRVMVRGMVWLGLALGCRHGHDEEAAPVGFTPGWGQAVVRRAVAVALADCDGLAGPTEPAQVEVQFEPAVIGAVLVQPEALRSSPRGACIERVVRFEAGKLDFPGGSGSVREAVGTLPSPPPQSAYPRLVSAAAPPSQRFDLAALQLAVFRAAKRVSEQCRSMRGPTGKGQIELQLGSDGKVERTELVSEQFRGTPSGKCAEKQFALVQVPPFTGTASPVLKTFVIGDSAESASGFDYEAAEQKLAHNPAGFDAAAATQALKKASLAAAACRAQGAWGWGEIQVDFLRYGSVDRATLLTERFQNTETGRCVVNAFREARVPIFGGPSSVFVQGFEVRPSGQPFDETKAELALAQAAELARNCAPKGEPTGPLEVGVRFGADGHASAVVLTLRFRNTVTASCVQMVFRRNAVVSPFDGPAPPLFERVEIPAASSESPAGAKTGAG
jgi:hypothetical protein